MFRRPLLMLLLALCSNAQAQTSPEALRATVSQFLTAQAASMPGKAVVEVGQPDARIALAACTAHEAFL
ncbi:hypothetical protein ABTO49_21290, partial [Acinetobacter baumannii]